MFNNLPQGVKISISRSISTAFEQYMKSIEWDEKKYNPEIFINEWKDYAVKHASWLDKIDREIKESPKFHEDLAVKINSTIEKILTEAPTQEQMDEIDSLVNKLNIDDFDYSCKAEAKYHIDRLKG